MNIQFLVVALVIGRSVDWIFQSQTQAVNKSHDYWQLFIHCWIYAAFTSELTLMVIGKWNIINAIFITFFLFATHFAIDNRILVRYILQLKGIPKNKIESGSYAWLEIGVDQRLHDVCILILALII